MNREVWAALGLKGKKAMAHWHAADEADTTEGGHGDLSLKILSAYADTREKQARVLEVLEESMQVRWHHFDSIGREALEAARGAKSRKSAA
jgi:pyrroloquinoline quinone (PQQ) biosynthesis protein C